MSKNLLIIHIEHLSQNLLWQYQLELQTLWSLMNDAYYFKNCYSAGASTIFAMNGVSQGSIAGLDARLFAYSSNDTPEMFGDKGLFEILRDEHGYIPFGVMLNEVHNDDVKMMENNILGIGKACCVPFSDPDGIIKEKVSQAVASGRPFAAYVHNYYGYFNNNLGIEGVDRFDVGEIYKAGFRQVDAAVASLLGVLEKIGVRENTLVVIFGDHGHSQYTKMFHNDDDRGTHAYSENVWVPLLIHNSPLGHGVHTGVASLIDMRSTIHHLLFPALPPPPSAMPHSGIDLTSMRRELAFSQNKYALQREIRDRRYTRKAYSVTDGTYRVVAQSLNPELQAGGMELYLEKMDPSNCSNLLDLFELDSDGYIVGYHIDKMQRGMLYRFILDLDRLVALRDHYHYLRDKLKEYILECEEAALRFPDSERNIFPAETFTVSATQWEKTGVSVSVRNCKGVHWLRALERPILVFGAGKYGKQVCQFLHMHNISITGMLDNAPGQFTGESTSCPVMHPPVAKARYPAAVVLGALQNPDSAKVVAGQCREMGFEYYDFDKDIMGFIDDGRW